MRRKLSLFIMVSVLTLSSVGVATVALAQVGEPTWEITQNESCDGVWYSWTGSNLEEVVFALDFPEGGGTEYGMAGQSQTPVIAQWGAYNWYVVDVSGDGIVVDSGSDNVFIPAECNEPPESSDYTYTLDLSRCDPAGFDVVATGSDPYLYWAMWATPMDTGFTEYDHVPPGTLGPFAWDTVWNFDEWNVEGDAQLVDELSHLDGAQTMPPECNEPPTTTTTVVVPPETIVVDGVSYPATQVSGPVVHYETPDVNPTSVYTNRHVWDGKHGAEHLPCLYGGHWVDNANLLTLSHCLEDPNPPVTTTSSTTSTTEAPPDTSSTTSTTEAPPDTSSTSTTEATTTSSTEVTTPPSTEGTTPPSTDAPPPDGGHNEGRSTESLLALALAGLLVIVAAVGINRWKGSKSEA